jgi:hypothetical protein
MSAYTNFGSAVPTQRIGTAGGMLHRKAPELSKRPYCEMCGSRERFQRKVANGYRCRGCDEEADLYLDGNE